MLSVNHELANLTKLANYRLICLMTLVRQVLYDAAKSVFPVSLIKHLAELWKFSQQAKRRPGYFKHHCRSVRWYDDSCVAFNSREHGHLAKTGSRGQSTNLPLFAIGFTNVDVE